MPTNPFFSGRIPQELHNEAEKYCNNTGKTKTELLIYALSTVLNFPITSQNAEFSSQSAETIKDLFGLLEQRIQALEHKTISHDDSIEQMLQLLNFRGLQTVISQILSDNNSDNLQPKQVSKENSEISSVIKSDNKHDNVPNNYNQAQEGNKIFGNNDLNSTITHTSFNSITSNEVVEIAKITNKQINAFKGNAIQKLKKQGKISVDNQLLSSPVIIEPKKPININGYPYKLEYLGENLEGNALWNLVPNEIRNNHLGTIELNYNGTLINPETLIQEENQNLQNQSLVEKDADEQI